MKRELIVRAWKDPQYRASLSAEQRLELPESPSGPPMTELNESELGHASGARPPETAPLICGYTERPLCTARRRCFNDC